MDVDDPRINRFLEVWSEKMRQGISPKEASAAARHEVGIADDEVESLRACLRKSL